MVIYMFKSIVSGWMIYLLHIAGQFHCHGPLHIELTAHRSNCIHIRMFFLCVNKRLINLTPWQLTLPIWGPRVQCVVRYTCPSYRIRFWIDRNGWQQLSSIDTGSVLPQDMANATWPATIPGRSFCSPNGKNKRIPCCHSSGQSCPGESGPIPRRAFRRAWEWDLTSRDNSVPKKWQRGIIFLTRNYQTIAKN